MIVTLTPNPSVDRTTTLSSLTPGGVNRAVDVRQDPGGKGVNVSRALASHGAATVAVLPLGGTEGETLKQLLADSAVPVRICPVAGSTRLNLTLAGQDGVTTKVNEPGPVLSGDEYETLLETFAASLETGGWALVAGSLPPQLPADFYPRVIDCARRAGAKIAVDSSGETFRDALAAGPDLVKPNHHELADAVGRTLVTVGDVVDAARELVERGIEQVVVSLGGSGAVVVTESTAVHVAAEKVTPVSTVGAGDALVAGYLLALSRGEGPVEALRLGTRFGTAAVTLPGSVMPAPADIAAITVTTSAQLPLDAVVEE